MMAVYPISTRINTNAPLGALLYDLYIYRMDSQKNKYPLLDVKKQLFNGGNETLKHFTNDVNEPLSTIYIMEVTLYRKTMLNIHCVTPEPFTKMYTLNEFVSGKAWSPVKRENPCYFETLATMKPASQGGETKKVIITVPERPFVAKDYPIGHPEDPFEREKVLSDIEDRYNYFSYPSQVGASVCGPAAFFYCLQMDRPDVYAQAAKELWQFGKTKIGELEIIPSEGCLHPAGHFSDNISGLDWMTLAGLRDSENEIFDFDSLDSPVAGVTLWRTLTEWFQKAGYEHIFSNVGFTQAGIHGINELNEYVNKGFKVVTLISDSLLRGSQSEDLTIPTHWIVWNGPVIQGDEGFVSLNLFSWGDVSQRIKSRKDISFFIRRFFGGVVFKPLK